MENLIQLSYLGKTHFIVAIKSLVFLANTDGLVTSNTLTEQLGSESSFIRKVMAKLIQENIVAGYSGRYGGYKLLVNPEKTTLYDIYIAILKDAHPVYQDHEISYIDQKILEIALESQLKIKEILTQYTISDLNKK